MSSTTNEFSAVNRHALLSEAAVLLNKKQFTHEDSARFDRLMALSDKLETAERGFRYADAHMAKLQDLAGIPRMPYDDPEARSAFRKYIRSGKLENSIQAAQTTGSTAGGGALIPQLFWEQLTSILKQYDRLFDPDVVTVVETGSGAPLPFPILDDIGNAAQIVAENQNSNTGPDLVFAQVLLAQTPTWRSGKIVVPVPLLQDSGFPVEELLIRALAVRIARGVGAQNVTTLLAAALVGATAAGSASNTGGAETGATSVGTDDLYSLMAAVNPAYLIGPKVGWAMNFSTLIALLKIKDKQGHPIIPTQHDDAGNFLLLEKPVYICPSMPNIGASNTPIALGDLSRFHFRMVKNSQAIMRFTEAVGLAENYSVAFQGYLRCNAALLLDSAQSPQDSPIKLLQNAAS